MPTFCSACGSTLAADANFCQKCGTPTSFYYSHSDSSRLDPTALSSSADASQEKVPTDYGSPPYGMPDKNSYDSLNPYGVIPPPPPPPRRVRSGLIVGIISGIVVSILILGVVGTFAFFTLRRSGSTPTSTASLSPAPPSQVPSQSCGNAFSDEFNGNINSRWNWINPTGSATYNLAPNGFLSITTPPNSDINPGNNFNAPRLLQPISSNFTVETLVKFSPIAFFQSAGLLIWQDQTKFLRFELGYTDRNGIVFQKDDGGLFSGDLAPFDHHLATASSIALRVQRQDDHFTVSWHEPGQVWQVDGETDIHFSSLMVGLDVLATYNAPQTTAFYDYFRISCA